MVQLKEGGAEMSVSNDLQAHADAATAHMTVLKRLSYVFPRYATLDAGFNSVLAQFISSRAGALMLKAVVWS